MNVKQELRVGNRTLTFFDRLTLDRAPLRNGILFRKAIMMGTVKLWTDAYAAAKPRVSAVFADIRATRGSALISNFWRALKEVMVAPGAFDPLVKELIHVAVPAANGCGYCVRSHTAAARAKGMTDAQHGELTAVVAMAAQTNASATTLQVPTDPEFMAGH